jgi:hypothetical protein
MGMRRYLTPVLALGLSFGLLACGGDDGGGGGGSGGGGNGNGKCPGANDSLIGSCLTPHGDCYEHRGDTAVYEGIDLAGKCATDDDGTWSTSACPAESKTAGGCLVEWLGAISISYHPGNTPEEEKAMCDSLSLCFVEP